MNVPQALHHPQVTNHITNKCIPTIVIFQSPFTVNFPLTSNEGLSRFTSHIQFIQCQVQVNLPCACETSGIPSLQKLGGWLSLSIYPHCWHWISQNDMGILLQRVQSWISSIFEVQDSNLRLDDIKPWPIMDYSLCFNICYFPQSWVITQVHCLMSISY